jgi:hypothetical protein
MRIPATRATFLLALLATVVPEPATSQPPLKVVATRWTYIFVTPQIRQDALARIETGVELSVLGTEGEWYLVEYESPRWGQRRGYVNRNDVRAASQGAKPNGQHITPKPAASPSTPQAANRTVIVANSRPVPTPDKSSVDAKLLVLESFLPAMAAAPTGSAPSRKLMLFGGRGHRTYLGCLSCPASAPDSIFNQSGKYGGCPSAFSDNLFCRGPFKEFGSPGPFHDESACANGASDPPVIVDGDGNYYGRFSVGGTFGHRDAVCGTFGPHQNQGTCETVEWVCQR